MDANATRRVNRVAAPLRREIVNMLREAIVTGELAPGERLVESSLCERYAVSRTVIREALRQLESEGLVTTVANRGPEVATLTAEDAKSLYEVRGALESLAGELFAQRASAQDRSELRRACDRVIEAVPAGDIHRLLEIKDEFYTVLLDGAKSTAIGSALRLIHARTQLLRTYSLQAKDRGPRTIAEIEEITRCAIKGDAEGTRLACVEHVRSAALVALSEMEANGDHGV